MNMWDQWVPVWVGGIRLHSTDSFRTQAGVARTELEGSVLSSFGNGLEGGSLPRLKTLQLLFSSPSCFSLSPLLDSCSEIFRASPLLVQIDLVPKTLPNPGPSNRRRTF